MKSSDKKDTHVSDQAIGHHQLDRVRWERGAGSPRGPFPGAHSPKNRTKEIGAGADSCKMRSGNVSARGAGDIELWTSIRRAVLRFSSGGSAGGGLDHRGP